MSPRSRGVSQRGGPLGDLVPRKQKRALRVMSKGPAPLGRMHDEEPMGSATCASAARPQASRLPDARSPDVEGDVSSSQIFRAR